MSKILFISHEASRTGAPLVLLYLMQWIKQRHSNNEINFVTLTGGGLEEEFRKSSDRYYNLSQITSPSLLDKAKHALYRKYFCKELPNKKKQRFITKLARENYDVIYGNTVVTIPLMTEIRKSCNNKPRTIAHVHELDTVIELFLPNLDAYLPDIDSVIAVSQLVKKNLISNRKVDPSIVRVIYECAVITENENIDTQKYTKEYFEIGASGNVHWRKGEDVFIQVARYIKANYPLFKVRFTWVGKLNDAQRLIIEADLKKMNLIDVVHFVGEQENPAKYYNEFDVFLMTSREDPFPLVCIEVGMMGKPIICFEGATGVAEILKNGGGFIVPYLSIEEMSNKICYYYNNPMNIESDGLKNKKQFAHLQPDNICEQLFSVISD